MYMNEEIINLMRYLEWEQEDDNRYVAIDRTFMIMSTKNIMPSVSMAMAGIDFHTLYKVYKEYQNKDIYCEFVYEHLGIQYHILTLNIYVCEDKEDSGHIIYSDTYTTTNSVDFLDLFEASDYGMEA